MANTENLKPIQKGELSKEEAKKRGSIGGKKSAEARREKKLIRDRILERMKEEDWDAYIDGIIARAKESKADAEFLRDTIGQKPIENIAVQASEEAKNDLKELLQQRKENAGKSKV